MDKKKVSRVSGRVESVESRKEGRERAKKGVTEGGGGRKGGIWGPRRPWDTVISRCSQGRLAVPTDTAIEETTLFLSLSFFFLVARSLFLRRRLITKGDEALSVNSYEIDRR